MVVWFWSSDPVSIKYDRCLYVLMRKVAHLQVVVVWAVWGIFVIQIGLYLQYLQVNIILFIYKSRNYSMNALKHKYNNPEQYMILVFLFQANFLLCLASSFKSETCSWLTPSASPSTARSNLFRNRAHRITWLPTKHLSLSESLELVTFRASSQIGTR